MSQKPFAHLHFHTSYSLLDSACRVKDVMETASLQGMQSVAITDHGVLYGAIDFYQNALKADIKPILGCEVYMAPHGTSMYEKKTGRDGSQSNHFVLLAETDEGYRNLVQLVSQAHLDGFYYKPRIDRELLKKYSKGLIGLSACLKGDVPEMIVQGDMEGALAMAAEYKEILGPQNYFIELQDHGIEEQRIANRGLIEVAKKLDLPLVATNDVHYVHPSDYEAHDCLICLQSQSFMSTPNRMKYGSDQFYMKTPDEMWDLFKDYPEALTNTVAIAERCNVDIDLSGTPNFPVYEAPQGHTQQSYLKHLIEEGLKNRYGIARPQHPQNDYEKTIADRYTFELEIITKTNFTNYFLVVWDFVRFSQDQGIPVGPGRGSGAGSIIAYALGITGIDPLKYDLIFERFLNPQRVSPPDFDIDFCQSRRGEVIEYVKEKYGRSNVAQIITFGTLGAKTVIRDIGRVLEVPFGECDKIAKMIPEEPGMTLEKAIKESPDFKKTIETDENAKRIMKYARTLEGLPRNQGTHAAGVIIGPRPLAEMIPIGKDKDQEVVTQHEMKPCEQLGLLKMDFLGLKTLTVIQEAVDNVRDSRGQDLDMDHLDMSDQKTFDLLNRGDTVGVFQVESKGMRDLLRRIGLDRFEDLIAMIALFRPGPMNMLDDYVNRKHGRVEIKYDHPLLEPILKETYGVMLYQEQVQRAANVLAGYTLGEGDILRRAMGKKILSEMTAQRQKFVDGCKSVNNISKEVAERIFNNIERFAGYGFNKSHSAAYAILSYRTAYLKAHFPAEFMAALLSSEMGNSDKLPVLISECKEMDLAVLAPSVNTSAARFRPISETQISFGMAGIKNVGAGAVECVVQEREENGNYEGLLDFCNRVDSKAVNKKVLESLVKCGAFDFSNMTRGRLFEGIEFALNRAAANLRDKESGQISLFGLMEDTTHSHNPEEDIPEAPPWPESQMLSQEKELLGFYISGHPLMQYEWVIQQFCPSDFETLSALPVRTPFRIGGLVTEFAKRFTKKTQEPMGTFRLETLDFAIDAVAFPEAFREYGVYLQENAPIMICGERGAEDELKVVAVEIYPLFDVPRIFAQKLGIHIPIASFSDEKLLFVREQLRSNPGDTSVSICLEYPGGEKVFVTADHSFKITVSLKLLHELQHVLGENSIYVESNPEIMRKPRKRQRKPWENNNKAKTNAAPAT